MTDPGRATPFFILGSPRSGTSLLSRMLDSHERLAVPYETLVFENFSSALRYYGDLSERDNQYALLRDILRTRILSYWTPTPAFDEVAPLIENPGFAGVIEALICSTASSEEIAAWGEKSPGHVFYWEEINACFPNAKVIHIVRDGRDVASSIIRARMGPTIYYAAARMWCKYVDAIEEIRLACPDDRYVEVRYEDLLSSPRESLARTCDYLGVSYSETMLAFHENSSPYQTDAVNKENLQQPLMESNKEKWRRQMTDRQIQEFESVAAEHLKRYDYPTANQLGQLSIPRRFVARWITSPVTRLVSRAKDTQGQKEFINIKLILFKRVLRYYKERLKNLVGAAGPHARHSRSC